MMLVIRLWDTYVTFCFLNKKCWELLAAVPSAEVSENVLGIAYPLICLATYTDRQEINFIFCLLPGIKKTFSHLTTKSQQKWNGNIKLGIS
jgi:hypothetical protein